MSLNAIRSLCAKVTNRAKVTLRFSDTYPIKEANKIPFISSKNIFGLQFFVYHIVLDNLFLIFLVFSA